MVTLTFRAFEGVSPHLDGAIHDASSHLDGATRDGQEVTPDVEVGEMLHGEAVEGTLEQQAERPLDDDEVTVMLQEVLGKGLPDEDCVATGQSCEGYASEWP